MGKIVSKFKMKAGIKFQFRQLDSFIHPNHQKGSKAKHIPRFLETKLETQDYKIMQSKVEEYGMYSFALLLTKHQ